MGRYFCYLSKIIKGPGVACSLLKGLIRGTYYILLFRMYKRNVIIRFPFFAYTKVAISGHGKVFIDRGCSVWMNTFEYLVIKTLSSKAEVRIGKNCTLGGLTIRCRGKVFLGDNVMTAANLIQDVMIISHSTVSLLEERQGSVSVIKVCNNVWLASQAIVLAGSSVGDGSVVGVGALICCTIVKDNCLVAGNPALRPVSISKIIKLQGA